jgi:hypothetical protein
MRLLEGGVAHVANVIEEDLNDRETFLHKPHIRALADICASVLATRNVNTAEWISVLPRKTDEKSKERYISRFLSNKLIKPSSVMYGFIPELISMCSSGGKTVILMLDQSKISNDFECLMVSLKAGERAIPVAWKVVETRGAIGFEGQETLLMSVLKMIPEGSSIFLAADRFYGTQSLVKWCKKHDWQYRIRLKGNLIFQHEDSSITPLEAIEMKMTSMMGAYFNNTNVSTNIGILWEKENGHKEPWFIAMDCSPSRYRTLDYSMRWGIECMFSDFKSRGFSITKTNLKHVDRIERLILILSIALYWAVSTGMRPKTDKTRHTKKNFIGH